MGYRVRQPSKRTSTGALTREEQLARSARIKARNKAIYASRSKEQLAKDKKLRKEKLDNMSALQKKRNSPEANLKKTRARLNRKNKQRQADKRALQETSTGFNFVDLYKTRNAPGANRSNLRVPSMYERVTAARESENQTLQQIRLLRQLANRTNPNTRGSAPALTREQIKAVLETNTPTSPVPPNGMVDRALLPAMEKNPFERLLNLRSQQVPPRPVSRPINPGYEQPQQQVPPWPVYRPINPGYEQPQQPAGDPFANLFNMFQYR